MAGEKILIVDDEKNMCQYLTIMLRREGYEVKTAHSGKKALQEIKEGNFDVVLTDIKMEGMDGIALLRAVKEQNPTIPVIIMTAYATQKTAIEALNSGAYYYLIKRAKNEEIKMVIRSALDMHKVKTENVYLKRQLKKKEDFKEIIGKSEEIQAVFCLVNKVADTDSTILISGESGTGKELIAKAIHYRSGRAGQPFVSINCGALPENLLESELFGHVKGSFTGAIRDKDGMFKVASGGTFFLDEVGETSLAIQVKLLRVLQEREIIPVGGTAPIKVDVRLIAATNADLEKAVKEERFRADLYYRLNVIPVHIPPLRERRDDIPLLVDHFLRIATDRTGRTKSIAKTSMDLLCAYDWPGNVRELENVIERGVILQDGDEIFPDNLPPKVCHHTSERRGVNVEDAQMTLDELEKQYLVSVLEETSWQKKKASSILGINASTLYRKIQRYGLSQERLKDK